MDPRGVSRFSVRSELKKRPGEPGEGFIAIDKDVEEVLCWDAKEWQEEPDLAVTISMAIWWAVMYPDRFEEDLANIKALTGG